MSVDENGFAAYTIPFSELPKSNVIFGESILDNSKEHMDKFDEEDKNDKVPAMLLPAESVISRKYMETSGDGFRAWNTRPENKDKQIPCMTKEEENMILYGEP